MSIKGRVQVNRLVHLVTIFRLPLKEASSLDERPINLLTAGVLVVVGLLGDGVHILGAVRDHTAVERETVLARVVGNSVVRVLGRLLASHQLGGQEEGRHTPTQHWSASPVKLNNKYTMNLIIKTLSALCFAF